MAIVFKSPKQSDLLMFDDDALRLLELMGATGELPGALRSEDLPNALQRLRAGVEDAQPSPATDEELAAHDDADDTPRPVSVPLAHRALPLTQMLEKAITRDQYLTWTRV